MTTWLDHVGGNQELRTTILAAGLKNPTRTSLLLIAFG